MKLDKIRFARLINWLSRTGLHELAEADIRDLDDITDIDMPPTSMTVTDLHTLMALMQEGTRKIEAIKQPIAGLIIFGGIAIMCLMG